jgi:hypothetical protein
MKHILILTAVAGIVSMLATDAPAGGPRAKAARKAAYFADGHPWNGDYAYTQDGGPVALVTPPNADFTTAWGWGVTSTEVRPLWHQYHRADPGPAAFGAYNPYLPTPLYPSHTDQFGVYPVRAPWR